MLRKFFLVAIVFGLISGIAVRPIQAQDEAGGIVCDDATYMLLLIAEINGYSQSQSTLVPPVDLTQFDLGENGPIFDEFVSALADEEMEPLNDEMLETLIPLSEEISAGGEELTQTEHGDMVDEDPACRELRESTSNYISIVLLAEYAGAGEE